MQDSAMLPGEDRTGLQPASHRQHRWHDRSCLPGPDTSGLTLASQALVTCSRNCTVLRSRSPKALAWMR